MGSNSDFSVEIIPGDGRCPVAYISGEIDVATVPEMGLCLASIIAMAPEALVFDFTDVSFFGATGLGALVEIRKSLPRSSHLIIRNPPPMVRKILTVTKMESLCVIEDELVDAA